MRRLRIAQAAALLGPSGDTLRRLEHKGVLPRVPRDRNGHRIFRDADLERWRVILDAPAPAPALRGIAARNKARAAAQRAAR